MGIKFRCHACDKKLHVKAFLAGKRGVCPRCGAKVRIPLESEETAGDKPRTSSQSTQSNRQRATVDPAKPAAASSPAATAGGSSAGQRPAGASAVSSASSRQRPAKSTVPDPISEAPEAVWYVRPPSGGQFGPADAQIMRRWLSEGRVSADSLVWREGWEDWKTGDTVFPSLRSNPAEPAAVSAPAAPADALADEFSFAQSQPAQAKPRSKKSHARSVVIVACLVLITFGLITALVIVLRG